MKLRDRQLALGRRAVLPPHRQADVAADTEIAIRFKPAPYAVFRDTPVDALPPNWLVLRIAPDEGISLQFEVKRPGPEMDLAAVKMDFRYDDWFPKEPNVGYETLIYDVMIGDPTLFMRADMVEQAWRIVQPVLDAWAAEKADFPNYNSGSDGPDGGRRTDGARRKSGLAALFFRDRSRGTVTPRPERSARPGLVFVMRFWSALRVPRVVPLPSARIVHQAADKQQHQRADDRIYGPGHKGRADMKADHREQPGTKEGSDNSDDEIAYHSEPGALHELVGKPSEDETNHQHDHNVFR